MPTCLTGESRLIRPVSFFSMSTARTLPGAVARIDKNHGDSFTLGLVDSKPLKLKKRPRSVDVSLTLSKPYPVSDAFEVLKDKGGTGAFSVRNNFFADAVVDIAHKTSLFLVALFQEAFCRLRAFLLKFSSKAGVAPAVIFYGAAGIPLPCVCCGYVGYPQINPHKSFGLKLRRFRNVTDLVKVKGSVTQHEVSFAPAVFEKGALLRPTHERNPGSTIKHPDAYRIILHAPRKDATIIGDRASALKLVLGFFAHFVGVGHLGKGTNSHLRGKIELVFGDKILRSVQVKLPETLVFPCVIRQVIGGVVSAFKCCFESVKLSAAGLKFHLCD